MTVRCKFCQEVIDLNADSHEARVAKTDPHQQMRRHLLGHPAAHLLNHTRNLGWLIDTLAFEAISDEDKWRDSLIELLDYFNQG